MQPAGASPNRLSAASRAMSAVSRHMNRKGLTAWQPMEEDHKPMGLWDRHMIRAGLASLILAVACLTLPACDGVPFPRVPEKQAPRPAPAPDKIVPVLPLPGKDVPLVPRPDKGMLPPEPSQLPRPR